MRQNYSFSKNGNALLEPCEGKLSCTVLRGESPSNGADLLDKDTIDKYMYDVIQTKKGIANGVTGTDDVVKENVVDMAMNLFNGRI